ncbi:hypothetical protein QBC45DRAFT_402938 [Copromyces sp. CBS 386.78]|nr:hypothetical protein QBC45DRAFT_402938 [Copromyces sp. CBS 386.78]
MCKTGVALVIYGSILMLSLNLLGYSFASTTLGLSARNTFSFEDLYLDNKQNWYKNRGDDRHTLSIPHKAFYDRTCTPERI